MPTPDELTEGFTSLRLSGAPPQAQPISEPQQYQQQMPAPQQAGQQFQQPRVAPEQSHAFDSLTAYLSDPQFRTAIMDWMNRNEPSAASTRSPNYAFVPTDTPSSSVTADGNVRRKPMAYPKWDGQPQTFYFYLNRLIFKYNIDGPAGLIGGDKVAWYDILETLPASAQMKVASFWQSGGPGGRFDPRSLFSHLEVTSATYKRRNKHRGSFESCECRTANHGAISSLLSMRSLFERADTSGITNPG